MKYEPHSRALPWSVYKVFSGKSVFETGFQTEDEAHFHVSKEEKKLEYPYKNKLNPVDEASLESFTAIDPTPFPYIPGLLSFREAPVILKLLG